MKRVDNRQYKLTQIRKGRAFIDKRLHVKRGKRRSAKLDRRSA